MQTEAQKAAVSRNWKIRQLRGMWAVVEHLDASDKTKQKALNAIDELLIAYNADTELVHRHKILEEEVIPSYIHALNFDTR